MRRERIFIWHLIWLLLPLHLANTCTSVVAEETGLEYAKGCAHLRCENGGRCVKRRFWCKNPPCPGMLYCSQSRKESLKGPLTCDTVRCSGGFVCVVKVRGCHWNEKCKQQVVRCVTDREYHESADSCAGSECPSGKHCILRESHCISPPCKLVRSCAEIKDAQTWFDRCKSLGCPSKYECFLRRSNNNCSDCADIPDCTLTTEDELINEYCRGWICPREQKCVVRIVGSCKGHDCIAERSCRGFSIASSSTTPFVEHDTLLDNEIVVQTSTEETQVRNEAELYHDKPETHETTMQTSHSITRKKPTSATSLDEQSTRYTITQQRETEASTILQQVTSKTSPVTEPSTSNGRHSTLPYPSSRLNHNELSITDIIGEDFKIADKDDVFAIDSRFSGWPDNSSSHATSFAGRKIEPTSRDTKDWGMPKIFIMRSDALPLPIVLERVFLGQGYPIWIRSNPGRLTLSGGMKDENIGRRYYAPRVPYRTLLPPYEPVILVEDARQFPPFLTYALDLSNEAALISSIEITSEDATENTKTDNIPATTDDKADNDINGSTTVEIENLKTHHFYDASSDYANFPATERMDRAPIIRDKELDNYDDSYNEWRAWLMIHDYVRKNESKLTREQELESNIDKYETDDLHENDTSSAETGRPARDQITGKSIDRVAGMRHTHNENGPASSQAPISTARNDCSSRDEEHRSLANYSYDAIIVRDIDKSRREHRGSSLREISDLPSSEKEDQRNGGQKSDDNSALLLLSEASSYPAYDDGEKRKSDREYDEYYYYEEYDDGVETTGS